MGNPRRMKASDFKKALAKQRPQKAPRMTKSMTTIIESLYERAAFWGRNDHWDGGSISFVLPCLLPGLNGDDGLMRQHFTKAQKIKEAVCYCLMKQLPKTGYPIFNVPVTITYTRFCGSKVNLMDWDNAGASFKHIGDALVKCGVIIDDNPHIVKSFTPCQEISTSKKSFTKIEITPL